MRLKRLIPVVSCTLVGSMAGCCQFRQAFDPQHDCRQDEAGSSHVAVLSVGKWMNYRDSLVPGFTLTADQALAAAVPNTADLEEKSLSASSGSLKVALPTGGTAGDPSKLSFSASPASGLSASALGPATSVLATPTSIDPFLQYEAATAIKQEVTLLNAYLKDALSDPDYEPYLVRLQVSLMPLHRNAPYDAYLTLSFFSGPFPSTGIPIAPENANPNAISPTKNPSQTRQLKAAAIEHLEALQKRAEAQVDADRDQLGALSDASDAVAKIPDDLAPDLATKLISDALANLSGRLGIKVVPLIVTDDIEMQNHSSASERVRQLALALSATIHGIGASGDLQKVDQNLRTLLGHDFNSVFTIARASENSFRLKAAGEM